MNARGEAMLISLSGRSAARGGRRPVADAEGASPVLAVWEMTQACDLVCVHCRACATPLRNPLELSTDEGRRLLEDIAAMGTKLVVLTGGDPAKRTDLVPLVAHGVALGLTMALTPSGTSLTTRPLLEQLASAGLSRLAVSIDGPDATTHDEFRRVSGSFGESMRILEEARSIGLTTQINTTLSPLNIGMIPAMAQLVEQLGAVLWSVFLVVPTGRADAKLLLTAEEVEDALHQLADVADRATFGVKTTAAPHFRRVLLERKAKQQIIGLYDVLDPTGPHRLAINDGSGFVFISHKGDICPSGFLPTPTGNIRHDSLAQVYRTHPLFVRLRDTSLLGGKCGVCPFRRVCGGSRARAYAMTGDAMASDPLCAYVPREWAELEAKADQ